MKLRIEISDEANDEIVISCKSITEEIKKLQDIIGNVIDKNAELVLHSNNSEHYIRQNDILFFETDSGRTAAHTAGKYVLYRLQVV